MTDPDVVRQTFTGTMGREPSDDELAQLIMGYLRNLPGEVHGSEGYRIMVVGDTPRDIEATRAVGAISVTVATGEYTADQLREAGADHVLRSMREPFPYLD